MKYNVEITHRQYVMIMHMIQQQTRITKEQKTPNEHYICDLQDLQDCITEQQQQQQ